MDSLFFHSVEEYAPDDSPSPSAPSYGLAWHAMAWHGHDMTWSCMAKTCMTWHDMSWHAWPRRAWPWHLMQFMATTWPRLAVPWSWPSHDMAMSWHVMPWPCHDMHGHAWPCHYAGCLFKRCIHWLACVSSLSFYDQAVLQYELDVSVRLVGGCSKAFRLLRNTAIDDSIGDS